jgi:microcystin-dependent protein
VSDGDTYLGEVRAVAFNFAPDGWALCQGQPLWISSYQALYDLIGTTYGGDVQGTFRLPDLRGRIPIGADQAYSLSQSGGTEAVTLGNPTLAGHSHAFTAALSPQSTPVPSNAVLGDTAPLELYAGAAPRVEMGPESIATAGGSQPHDNLQPYLVVNYIVNLDGAAPDTSLGGAPAPFIGEIRPMAINFAPAGWAACDGQLMSVDQEPALFSLLGPMFGGNGKSTFALPDLRGQVAMGTGQGAGLSRRDMGERGGAAEVGLIEAEMPTHAHAPVASMSAATSSVPSPSASFGNSVGGMAYRSAASNMTALGNELATAGGGAPHNNMQPYLVLEYAIAIRGVFPPRS